MRSLSDYNLIADKKIDSGSWRSGATGFVRGRGVGMARGDERRSVSTPSEPYRTVEAPRRRAALVSMKSPQNALVPTKGKRPPWSSAIFLPHEGAIITHRPPRPARRFAYDALNTTIDAQWAHSERMEHQQRQRRASLGVRLRANLDAREGRNPCRAENQRSLSAALVAQIEDAQRRVAHDHATERATDACLVRAADERDLAVDEALASIRRDTAREAMEANRSKMQALKRSVDRQRRQAIADAIADEGYFVSWWGSCPF